jgi:hypothetical protein
MEGITILGWTSFLIVGSFIAGTGIHFFRCNKGDFVGYADGSTLAYYCPIVSESEAIETLQNWDKVLQDELTTLSPLQPNPELLRLGK